MTDLPIESDTSLPEQPYVPFPSFVAFTYTEFDLSTVSQFIAILEQAKAASNADTLRAAVDRATRWAAVDTGAIEGLYDVDRGFTFSVAAGAAAWDNMHLKVGDSATRSIQDAMNAYEFVLDVATESRPVTETWIRELHSVICKSQDTYSVLTSAGPQEHELQKGAYKQHKNNPFNLRAQKLHAYAPVEDTGPEMHRLIEELNSELFTEADPVVQAAYAHYAFVCIHPFADGNGRVARALASVYLYRSPGAPLVIFADQKNEYIDCLEAADSGGYDDFVRFIANCTVDIVRMVAAEMRKPNREPAQVIQAQLKSALLGRGGLPHEEIDALAGRLLDEWLTSLQNAVNQNSLNAPLSFSVQQMQSPIRSIPDGYRSSPDSRRVILNGSSQGVARANGNRHFSAVIAKGQSNVSDFLIVDGSGSVIEEALLRDMTPGISPSLRYRLDIAAETQVLELLAEVQVAAQIALQRAGYTD